ncbi:hypothetical protein CPT_Stills80 [Bacillus phage Stills]|uniref:Uncharacterized protein n=1 Tax=Bacillus phage Stills TaxID=1610833 RepID=A0A0E3X9N2_9CAUD|nr:hypothetical protein CPT_Stills80 [Bacillus phage Stills]AKC02708.1 hypothetical protein CPT_Stills80 [Bacillus phage Stills]
MIKLAQLYADGDSLKEIMVDLDLEDIESVKHELRNYLDLNKNYIGNGKRFLFTEEVKDVITDRFQNGYSIYSIVQDTALPTSTVSNFIKSRNVSTKRRFKYEVIKWRNFDRCPTCKDIKHVRRLGVHNLQSADEKTNHAFCTKCNTEWYKEDKKVLKVNWEMIK